MVKKRGQAAMEFLMIYGWAFMAVIAVIGALTYFGFLDTTQFLSERCRFSLGMGCDDILISTKGNGIIRLTNSIGRDIMIKDLTLASDDRQIRCGLSDSSKNIQLSNGYDAVFSLVNCSLQELPVKKFKGTIFMEYEDIESKFNNTLHAVVVTHTEPTIITPE